MEGAGALPNTATESLLRPLDPRDSPDEAHSDAPAVCGFEPAVAATVTTARGVRGTASVHTDGSFSFHRDSDLVQPAAPLWSRLPCLRPAAEVPAEVSVIVPIMPLT